MLLLLRQRAETDGTGRRSGDLPNSIRRGRSECKEQPSSEAGPHWGDRPRRRATQADKNTHKKRVIIMNLREWSEKYLEIYKKPFIKYSTYSRYRCCLNDIPEIALDQIDVIDLQLIINSMMSRKKSVSSIKQVKILVLQALRRAHMLGYTENIDFTMIDMPKTKKIHIRAFSEDEQLKIINNAYKSHYGDLFLALLYTGCRVGELIALEWSDVDFRRCFLNINKADYRGCVGTPKTESSIRSVPMSEECYKIFRKNFRLGYSGRVFRNTFGLPVNYRSLLDAWKRLLSVLDIQSCGMHVLRHTYATNALRAGVNYKVLSKLLGHGSVSVTLDVYCDVLEDDKLQAAQQITAFFSSLPRTIQPRYSKPL